MPILSTGSPPARYAILAAALAMAGYPSHAQTVNDCVGEADDARRLQCYDHLFHRGGAGTEAPSPAPAEAAASSEPPGVWGGFWETEAASRRERFVVRTYLPNFLLPLHYSTRINSAPESPTHAASLSKVRFQHHEAKFQISLRVKLAEDMLFGNDGLWLAYTQRSLWQVWNREESAPFRNTDYQPEAIYVVPVPRQASLLPAGWRWRLLQAGIAHQSNGQGEPLSRSWNRVYVGTILESGGFGLQARFLKRLPAFRTDDNPDLTRYIGNMEVAASWLGGPAWASLTWRTNPRYLGRGSLQFDWSYPVSRERPEGLRWYVQLFSGYGETLVDYNHRQTSIGLGMALFQF